MRYALFTLNFENIVSSPSTLESQVLILPKDLSLVIASGVYGINNADTPAIVYSPYYIMGHKDMSFSVEGSNPFSKLETVEIDGKKLSKAPWVPDPRFTGPGFEGTSTPLTPAPGTWITRDPVDPGNLSIDPKLAYGGADVLAF